MAQSVLGNKPDTRVTFSIINRTSSVPLARLLDEGHGLLAIADHLAAEGVESGHELEFLNGLFGGLAVGPGKNGTAPVID